MESSPKTLMEDLKEALELELEQEYGYTPGGVSAQQLDDELNQWMTRHEFEHHSAFDISIKALYDKAVRSTRGTLEAMKPLNKANTDNFCALYNVFMALQHWEDDICHCHTDDKTHPLLTIEGAGHSFENLTKTLRSSFSDMIRNQEQLRNHLSRAHNPVETTHRDLITCFERQVSALQDAVTPLGILSDRNRGVGPAGRIAQEVEKIRRKPQNKKPSESIYERAVKSHFDVASRDFIPDGVVEEFINSGSRGDLVAELKVQDSGQGRRLVDYIIEKGSKLFAITAGMGFGVDKLILAMEIFLDNEVEDAHLPFLTAEELKSRGLTGDKYILLEDLDYEFWEKTRCSSFRSIQWQFCVPRFKVGKICPDLHQQAILPFIFRDNEPKRGGFGEVFQVRIHERHIEDPNHLLDALPEYYAVKFIKPNSPKKKPLGHFFSKEAGNLESMMERKVKNVVRFIAAFRRENDSERESSNWNHYIVCEWADGGNVHDIWKREPSPLLSSKLVSEVTIELLGLAEALVAAHYPETGRTLIRHGDLKPDNILCFLGGGGGIGILKIGDWGLSKQKNNPTALNNQPSSLPGDTVRYTAPETLTGILIDGKIRRDRKSRLQDTWAMGCIILEFIMWMLYGLKHVEVFQAKLDGSGHRAYWEEDLSKGLTADEKKAKVSKFVSQEMEMIAKDPMCGSDPEANAIAALLELVRTRLLVVPLPEGLGHIDMIPEDDEDDSELLDPRRHPSAIIRRSTMLGDDEMDIGTSETDARSLAPSTRRSSLDFDKDVNWEEKETQEMDHNSDGGLQQLPSEIPVVVVHEHQEDDDDGPEPQPPAANPQVQGTFHSAIDLTARARSMELREKLENIVRRGEASTSYWLMESIAERQASTSDPTPADKVPAEGDPRSGNTDSGYGTGNSGGRSLESSDAPAVTYSSSLTLVGSSSAMSNPGGSSEGQSSAGLLAPQKQRNLDYTFPVLDKDWNFHVDNSFAAGIFSLLQDKSLSGFPDIMSVTCQRGQELCEDCEVLRVWELGFSIQYKTEDLRARAMSCDLCGMFWDVCVKRDATGLPTARFVKEESWLKLNGSGPPVLSLLRDPYLDGPANLQVGLPARPASGSPAHFAIMRQWLEVCRSAHNHPPVPPTRLPTRLLEVGQVGDENVLLRESQDPDFVEDHYVALSHPWGKPPHFCTFKSNIASHKKGIKLSSLPSIFRDAVITTRAIGIRYLWIDSICIIQGPEGDFQEEARRMEQVFSAAVCVLAASSATGQSDGWLSSSYVDTSNTSFVSLRYSSSISDTTSPRSIYITPVIDNFAADVLESPLNRRGWVLQERALARRTIYFTKTQTYFECGDGVRCSTMTKMTNSLAMLLGDSVFPQIVTDARKGEQILRYQDFYRNYSRLGLTRDYDRPVAIAGLQSRLLKAFKTEGGFGIFDEGPQLRGHLGRSLLWIRGDDVEALEEIEFPVTFGATAIPTSTMGEKNTVQEPPPSWSWMAYSGGIDYLDLEFGEIDWEPGISTPWSRPGSGIPPTQSARFVSKDGSIIRLEVLSAMARDFNFQFEVPQTGGELADRVSTVEIGVGSDQGAKGKIIFDRPSHARGYLAEGVNIKCVVLGRTSWSALSRSREGAGLRTAYVIVIVPWSGKVEPSLANADEEGMSGAETAIGGRIFWRRVGAGYLPSRSISAAPPVLVEIV